MVHQSPRSSAEYIALMEKWGEHFTCIAPDTPGFGQSDPLPPIQGREPEINDFADALSEFIAALGLKQCLAYGFHSGGIILVATVKRHPALFSALAIGGYAVWTEAEMKLFGERYLPEWHPSDYGEHLTWLWNRMLEQSWFFPWFDLRDSARLTVAHADIPRVNQAVLEMLDAGNHYRAGYGAVLRAPRDIPYGDDVPPCLITAYKGDPLQDHIERLGKMPKTWRAQKVATPQDHQLASLTFLQTQYDDLDGPSHRQHTPNLSEDPDEGWLAIDGGHIHWRGTRGASVLTLHPPASAMADLAPDTLAIDVPGHGHSSPFADMGGAIEKAKQHLGAKEIKWPDLPLGDPDKLYPDLTPDRFGGHLLRAWGTARSEAFFSPWYQADHDHRVQVKAEAITPEAIARRAYARLRAGNSAKQYHELLQYRQSAGRA